MSFLPKVRDIYLVMPREKILDESQDSTHIPFPSQNVYKSAAIWMIV